MSTIELTSTPTAVRHGDALWRLAVLETRRYARHPLFLVGVLLTIVTCIGKPDVRTSSFYNAIVPAAALGVLGLVVMASMTRNSTILRRSAGATPVPERIQTGALAVACLLPFTTGFAWFFWAVWAYHAYPVPANGFPFGPVTTGWKLAMLFGEGTMSTLGGPLLGIVIGRWWPKRGVAPLLAVLLVAAVIVMQGLFEPLRRIRVIMPFTYWGGPIGIKGDDMRMILMTGSPQWWVVYLACLCGLAIVAALWHDRKARSTRLRAIGAILLVTAVVACLLAMLAGLDQTLVNPLPSS